MRHLPHREVCSSDPLIRRRFLGLASELATLELLDLGLLLLNAKVTLLNPLKRVGMPGFPITNVASEFGNLTSQVAVLRFDLIQPCRQAGQTVAELLIDDQQLRDRKTRRR